MAYAKFYTYEYSDFPSPELIKAGEVQWLWRVSFLRDDYSGNVITVQPVDNPLTIEIDGQSDNPFSGLLAEKYTFDLICDNKLQASALYVQSDDEVQVLIEVDKTNTGNSFVTYATGWLQASELKEAYEPIPYSVTVSASCGLSRLKTRPFLDENGKRVQGMVSLSYAIRLCLLQTGISSKLVSGVNLFELADIAVGQLVNGLVDPAKCPLYQSMLPAEWFITDSGSVRMCDDVLKSLIAPHLRIEQGENGYWWLVRAVEAAGGWDKWAEVEGLTTTIRTRTYASDVLTDPPSNSASINLNVYANPSGILRSQDGGTIWNSVTKVGVRVEQAFGRYLSKLPDFSLIDSTTGLPVGYAALGTPTFPITHEGSGTEIDPYAMVISEAHDQKFNGDQEGFSYSISYDVNSPQYQRYFSYNYAGTARLTNIRGAKMAFAVERDDPQNGPYFSINGTWTALRNIKSADANAYVFPNTYTDPITQHAKAIAGWYDFSADLGSIDRVRKFTIYYFWGEALDHFNPSTGKYEGAEEGQTNGITPKVEYQVGRLTIKDTSQELDGTRITIVKTGKIVNDSTLAITYGDVPDVAAPADRIGALSYRGLAGNIIAATLWYRPNANVLATNATGDDVGKTWIEWMVEEEANQYMAPASMVDTTLHGRLLRRGHTVIQLGDVGNTVSGSIVPYAYQITRLIYKTRDVENQVTAQRIMPPVSLSAFTITRDWETPNGIVPIGTDETGNATAPPGRPLLSDIGKLLGQFIALGGIRPPALVGNIPGYGSVPVNYPVKLPVLTIHGITVGGPNLGTIGAGMLQNINVHFL